ncbi:arylphorin subunit A4-like [Musca domestica]|uniref:Arylphorin subunit A4-like n=1 Tax=Musca domestica TaxID=7370 RepID=A0A9J7CUC1_MUSDO|nr:arylphorin subunit A4-like [Musca domestica]
MKFSIVLLVIAGLVTIKAADRDFLSKQKFLFEVVFRVEEPLMFEQYIKLGMNFSYDQDDYVFPEQHSENMEKYYEAYKYGVTLPRGEYFGSLASSHFEQMYGLFEFFYYAKNWEIFQRNVCWARLHANEGMFVQALTLAVMRRNDIEGLILPTIYEIIPQHFFNSKFIYEAEKFDYDVWSKYIMYEKEYKGFLYKDYSKYFEEFKNYEFFYTKDFKTWQWWKLMGLGEQWYAEDNFIMRDNMNIFNNDSKYLEMMNDVNIFYMPVDYTRDVNFFNKESALSYFTEDVEWNSFWYYFNMDYIPNLNGEQFGLKKDRQGEYFFYVVRQLLARYFMELLSHGYGEIPELSFFTEVEHGYDPQLVNYNGVGYSSRKNYYEYETYGNFDYMRDIIGFFKRVEDIITQGLFKTRDGKVINLRKPRSIEYLGNLMQGNADNYDTYFATFWYLNAHMYFANINGKQTEVHPNVFLNYETMMRDPVFYMIYKKVNDVFFEFYDHIEPYKQKDLNFPGVEIDNINVSDLVTYFDIVDIDATNLLNDKMTFVDGKFVWDKTLLARQMRLNHKDFEFEYKIKSDKKQKVVIRAFLGPKFDEFGRVISLNENRENFFEIDEFYYELKPGFNSFNRSSKDFYWTTDDHTTYTELYKFFEKALEGEIELPLDYSEPHCGFPDRLILPRGWEKGMPMQFAFFVYPYTALGKPNAPNYSCGNRSGVRHIGDMPFGYPFDREIDEFEFFVPNMYFKDVKIYYEDTFEKYYEFKYDKFGTFDYNYYYDY